jgi:hypothetical protein
LVGAANMKFDVDGTEPKYELWGLCFIVVVLNYIYWAVPA